MKNTIAYFGAENLVTPPPKASRQLGYLCRLGIVKYRKEVIPCLLALCQPVPIH